MPKIGVYIHNSKLLGRRTFYGKTGTPLTNKYEFRRKQKKTSGICKVIKPVRTGRKQIL